ncbi:MAG: hypothetical protein JSU61_05945 [Fidelibacterota bacterium]|nr:MAG: hypothetical protein JSU61_05945 [Candidatus Neomarinimicrobiota bacterium]
MKAETALQDSYFTCPDLNLAEGEIDLDSSRSDSEGRVLPFIVQLCQAALQRIEPSDRNTPILSSLSTRHIGGELTGRLYGQAWVEKQGDTVAFLRAKLINERGDIVMTAMATSHHSS